MTAEGNYPKTSGDILYASEVNQFVPVGSIISWCKTFNQRDSGTTTSTTTNKLVQTGQNFVTTVTVGDVVYNTTDDTFAYVTAIDSDTTLTINADIMVSGETYEIYATPALPENFVECNGQTLNDSGSRFNGATIPDLNGEGRFMKAGISSGDTGGTDTIASHNHQWQSTSGSGGVAIEVEGAASQRSYDASGVLKGYEGGGVGYISGNYYTSKNNSHDNRPSYYQVVKIMKVK